jgi:hypothetical protein
MTSATGTTQWATTAACPAGARACKLQTCKSSPSASSTTQMPAVRGFDRQHHPMHLAEGIGQVWGSVRDPILGRRDDIIRFGEVGAGYSSYNSYDETIRDAAVAWLRRASRDECLWMLFIGFVAPHFPLIAPQRFVDLYPAAAMPLPKIDSAKRLRSSSVACRAGIIHANRR